MVSEAQQPQQVYNLKRIRSVPGNRVLPVRSSAIIHPTDQISTAKRSRTEIHDDYPDTWVKRSRWASTTCHVVMHPVQHDLRRTVPASGHVAGHLIIGVPCQTKVQNLETIQWQKNKTKQHTELIMKDSHFFSIDAINEKRRTLTFSSQSSFTARLPGFKSCRGGKKKKSQSGLSRIYR